MTLSIHWEQLQKTLEGELFWSGKILQDYALDQSIFSIKPQALAYPKHSQDLKLIVEFCQNNQISLTPRGAGSGVAGQAIGKGLIVDCSRFMNKISSFDESNDYVWVEPGVTLKQLNEYLKPYSRKFAPDPGSSDYCTLGGMFACNAAGPFGLKYGSTKDHVQSFDLLLNDLRIVNSHSQEDVFLNLVKQTVQFFKQNNINLRQLKKNSSGYNFNALLTDPPSIEKFFAGTEGTLGFVTRLQLKTVPLPQKQYLRIFCFKTIEEAAASVNTILNDYQPDALELLDSWLLKALSSQYSFFKAMIKGENNAILCAQWETKARVQTQEDKNFDLVYETDNAHDIDQFWSMRKQASPILHQHNKNRKPLRCIEDTVVPVESLKNYIIDLKKILQKHDCLGPIFGHIGMGHIHVNPWIKVGDDIDIYLNKLMQDVYALVDAYQGSISGEHGDGLLRAPYVVEYQKELLPLYKTIKQLFDPQDLFNPDKIFGPNQLNKDNLRDLNSPWNNIIHRS
ncbi:MAG TPA: FAD-binding oxidoreductase [Oligoflexia bacterium]|nr:FAD-binding oxidoreductase [Oligoflexia bacterium]HMR24037.1 FAD-binding oxidoreductase [Oligoflexia bacterium]